jgi:predicted ferric reductase
MFLIGTLFLVPLAVLHNIALSVALKYHASETDFLQRLLGLAIYILLFWQIIVVEYMGKFKKWLGGWIGSLQIWEGILIYFLIFLHPLMFLLFRHFSGTGTDPIFVFLDFCGYCQTRTDFYWTLGRLAFWILTAGVVVWLFKSSIPFLKKSWKSFSIVNYFVFLLAGIHGYLSGTDFTTRPFFYFAVVAYIWVFYIVIQKLPSVFSAYKKWLNS